MTKSRDNYDFFKKNKLLGHTKFKSYKPIYQPLGVDFLRLQKEQKAGLFMKMMQ